VSVQLRDVGGEVVPSTTMAFGKDFQVYAFDADCNQLPGKDGTLVIPLFHPNRGLSDVLGGELDAVMLEVVDGKFMGYQGFAAVKEKTRGVA
jgi:hypothetical protein